MMTTISLVLWALLGTSTAAADSPSWRVAPDGDAYVAAMEAPLPALPADWETHTDPYAAIYAAPEDAGTARLLSRHISRSLPRIAEEMGLPIGNRVHVYLTPDQSTFAALQPGQAPTWADGTAYPHRGLVFLRAPRIRGPGAAPLEQVMDHELAHILLGRAFGAKPVPRWLQEGVAQLVAREYTPATLDRLGQGTLSGSLLSIDELAGGFPEDPLRARLAYAQSADLVAYIYAEHGPEALQTVIREMAGGAPFAAALRTATGASVDALDARWRSEKSVSDMLWLRPLVSDTTLLSLAGIGFFVAGGLALRRRRQRLHEMGEEDAAVEAWYTQLGRTDGLGERYYSLPDGYALSADPPAEPRLDTLDAHQSPHGPH